MATLLAGAASVLAAAWLSLSLLSGLINRLVSVSAGLLLGSAVLNLIPEAFESGADLHALAWALLLGLIGFFVLEKLSVLRHSHHHEGDGHHHHHGHDREEAGPGGLLILVGDGIHNFADGVMIAAAFIADPALGWLTTAAIAAHEIPQEIGDFIILINAGYARGRALLYNVLSGLVGGRRRRARLPVAVAHPGTAAVRAGAGRCQLHLRRAGRPDSGPASGDAPRRRVVLAVRADDGGCGGDRRVDRAGARALTMKLPPGVESGAACD